MDFHFDSEDFIQFSLKNNIAGKQRVITNPTNALGILRQDLINSMGIEPTKAFLLRYGWNCGISDGERIKETIGLSQEELLLAGPKMFTSNGHGYALPLINQFNFNDGKLHFEGVSKNSFEAEQHIKLFGLSEYPVCYTMIGYASGYLSKVLGKQVIAKEVECEGKGDDYCRWVCKTVDEWDGDSTKEISYYESFNISDELTKMYDALKLERDNLQTAINIHNQLMENFLNGSGTQSFADVIYQVTNIPVMLEDDQFNQIAIAGIEPQLAKLYSSKLKGMVNQKCNHENARKMTELRDKNQTVEFIQSNQHKRLISPINVGKSLKGYCSFINTSFKTVDGLILKQLAVTCSLYLFNEQTIFETEQRLKGGILEDILNKRLTPNEIFRKANHIGVDLGTHYYIFVLEKLSKDYSGNEQLEINDDGLIPAISKYFKDRNLNVLLTQQSKRIVALLPTDILSQNFIKIEEFIRKFINSFKDKSLGFQYIIGISSESTSIDDAPNLLNEAIASSKMANHQKKIVFFDDLGIVGILFQTGKLDHIRNFCNKILGKVFEYDQRKKTELTKTLFYYIKHGNLFLAASEMNMSIGGMRYRLQKLTEILDVDLNDPEVISQIFLALQSSIVLGDIDIG